MKKMMLGLLCAVSLSVAAQDTIYTRNGEVVPAKVYEITSADIKYKKPSNPDGPLYVMSKDEVAVIEYKNGSKDVFQKEANADANKSVSSANNQPGNNTYSNPRPRVNVMINPPPVVIGPTWGWRYYRPYRYHRHWRHGCW